MTFTSRSVFEVQVFTVTTSEDFSGSQIDTAIGDTVATRFTSGVITISSTVRASTEGNYLASIKGETHPDRFNNSKFAALHDRGTGL